jgi:D-alanyl-D-alanine dipeptidase
MLRPLGVELLILDAYRPAECQRSLWEFHLEQARLERPGASEQEWRAMALQRAADPDAIESAGATAWPAHTTGGAVDTTLRNLRGGEPLDMGSRFEEVTDISYTDYFERQLERGEIAADDPRLLHRRMLHWSLSAQGLLNDPFVFWHYDWGNQLYVKNRRAMFNDPVSAAWYGAAQPPPESPGNSPR